MLLILAAALWTAVVAASDSSTPEAWIAPRYSYSLPGQVYIVSSVIRASTSCFLVNSSLREGLLCRTLLSSDQRKILQLPDVWELCHLETSLKPAISCPIGTAGNSEPCIRAAKMCEHGRFRPQLLYFDLVLNTILGYFNNALERGSEGEAVTVKSP